ncbi:uncharacterized protein LOC113464277 [Ceratina calcarata]|uniref:Uncharacterized protein LOC113464277 n=1 Tax=Ceratina calcarata TaxID=156304 RepID=A0AAJ7S061_9HYME|nr:uncharacterized protein LOC113464277 [Ceratina calcarata]
MAQCSRRMERELSERGWLDGHSVFFHPVHAGAQPSNFSTLLFIVIPCRRYQPAVYTYFHESLGESPSATITNLNRDSSYRNAVYVDRNQLETSLDQFESVGDTRDVKQHLWPSICGFPL